MNDPIMVKGSPTAISFKAVRDLPGPLIDGRNALIISVLQAFREGKIPPKITVNIPADAPNIRCWGFTEKKLNLNDSPGEKG